MGDILSFQEFMDSGVLRVGESVVLYIFRVFVFKGLSTAGIYLAQKKSLKESLLSEATSLN